ncbi:MAG: hypothetical protein IIA59_00510 [Candidatus Marinimicrobia bacterium]|nr:hypothetical protein [Candidatus Neomarinimicrobiota bacterium]
MGHHIIIVGGRKVFQSDKYPDLPPGKIVLSFKDPVARRMLKFYGMFCPDRALGEDIVEVLDDIKQHEHEKV